MRLLERADRLNHGVLDLLVSASDRAILPRYRQLTSLQVHEKATDEIVTVADRDSEEILSAGLARLLPEAEIVGEEAADADPKVLTNLSAPLCWIIDPLDGTANFAAGDGPFGMLVALASFGHPIGGWIFDPRSRRFCCATKGGGFSVNGKPTVVALPDKRVRSAAMSSLYAKDPVLKSSIWRKIGNDFDIERIPRCAAEQYPRQILGGCDITLFHRTLAWDHAAGAICMLEAGGIVTRLNGELYKVDDRHDGLILANDPEQWSKAMQLLANDEVPAF